MGDSKTAIGSNLYFGDIRQNGVRISQKTVNAKSSIEEDMAYEYLGTTEDNLLVVLAAYNGGDSGDFITLHILDIAPACAFDLHGKLY